MSSQEKVLIVEDEPHALSGLAELVSGWGYRTETARDGLEALEKVSAWQPGIIVSDLKMPRMDGLQLLARLGESSEKVAVIMLTAQGSIESAVEAMKSGAYDFIQKPVDPTRLRAILTNASRQRDTERELEVTRRKLRETGVLGSLVGSSKKMQEVFALIERVATSNVSVLITGESGTGKELVARTLHDLSPRRAKPFVAVNCAAIPETLIESEIFGHEKGAFTGAVARRIGKFEEANGGTLLLDEVSEMHPRLQAKLLRAIQEREIDRVGGTQPIKVDIRLIATSNRDLDAEARNGNFREDLYFRLNVVNVHVPPLRERPKDVDMLADFFAKKYAEMNALPQRRLGPALREKLLQHAWRGNVRELENAMHRAVLLGHGEEIGPEAIALPNVKNAEIEVNAANRGGLVGRTVADVERDLILETLQHCLGNRTHAANILGISIRTLRNKLQQYRQEGLAVPLPSEAATA